MSSTFHAASSPLASPASAAVGLEVFYDSDCGFCTRTARVLHRLDRAHRLRLVPLQAMTDASPGVPSQAQLLEAMHAREASGRWFAGGAAWLRIAHLVPILMPLAFVAELPFLRILVEPTYALIARNRHHVSRLMGDRDCALDRSRG